MTLMIRNEAAMKELRELAWDLNHDICDWCYTFVQPGVAYCDRCYEMILEERKKREVKKEHVKADSPPIAHMTTAVSIIKTRC